MKATLMTFQNSKTEEISGHLEKEEGGQVKNSYGWYRTENPDKAFKFAKTSYPDVDIVNHKHTVFN